MALEINDSIFNKSPKDLNEQTGVFTGTAWRPWNDINEALTSPKLIPAYRNRGLTIYILKNNQLTEYWFRDGIEDEHLIEKNSSGVYFNIYFDDFESNFITYNNIQLADSNFTVEYAGNINGGGSFDRGLLLEGIEYTKLEEGGFELLSPYRVYEGDVFQISNASNSISGGSPVLSVNGRVGNVVGLAEQSDLEEEISDREDAINDLDNRKADKDSISQALAITYDDLDVSKTTYTNIDYADKEITLVDTTSGAWLGQRTFNSSGVMSLNFTAEAEFTALIFGTLLDAVRYVRADYLFNTQGEGEEIISDDLVNSYVFGLWGDTTTNFGTSSVVKRSTNLIDLLGVESLYFENIPATIASASTTLGRLYDSLGNSIQTILKADLVPYLTGYKYTIPIDVGVVNAGVQVREADALGTVQVKTITISEGIDTIKSERLGFNINNYPTIVQAMIKSDFLEDFPADNLVTGFSPGTYSGVYPIITLPISATSSHSDNAFTVSDGGVIYFKGIEGTIASVNTLIGRLYTSGNTLAGNIAKTSLVPVAEFPGYYSFDIPTGISSVKAVMNIINSDVSTAYASLTLPSKIIKEQFIPSVSNNSDGTAFNRASTAYNLMPIYNKVYGGYIGQTVDNYCTAIFWGDSIIGQDKYASLTPSTIAQHSPPGVTTEYLFSLLYRDMKGGLDKPTYLRYDSPGAYTEVGTFTTIAIDSATPTRSVWDDNTDRSIETRISNTPSASVTGIFAADLNQNNILYRTSTDGAITVTLDFGGTGRIEIKKPRTSIWIEGHGATITMRESAAVPSSGLGNTRYAECLETRKTDAVLNTAITWKMTKDSSSNYLMYWGTEGVEGRKSYTYNAVPRVVSRPYLMARNFGRGGHNIADLNETIVTDVFDRKPDFLYMELPLINEFGGNRDLAGVINSVQDFVYGDRVGFENPRALVHLVNKSAEPTSIFIHIPHISQGSYNADGTYIVREAGYTAGDIWNGVISLLNQKGQVPFFNMNAEIKAFADLNYEGNIYNALEAGILTVDGTHFNDSGNLFMFNRIRALFQQTNN